ncbi:hypothetical protein [Lysobacter gummosus]|uniref:Uncharacterized protein n=1 Tax=Lysobacter gummosus TaxID=262324 RepID=A0ABY3XEN7_9GAMM|nr:hypothetical protein [Lysobacter gummosus]UNP29183.1 hypothetical protein MOV92_22385 [Lysobacter gummosus]
MTLTYLPAPPNPTRADDPIWTSFNDYLVRHEIKAVIHPALKAYQHAADGRFLSAHNLNHCLTLEALWRFPTRTV